MKLAIIGTGISGLTCAHLLHPHHDITIYEANDYIGGHTNTVDEESGGETYAVDTGFIVFNDWTYPNFIRLMERLGVESQPGPMSFSVKCERTGLEYNGTSLNTLFAQRRNIVNPRFHRMLRDILRFNKEAKALPDSTNGVRALTLAEYLERERYSPEFVEFYLRPMGAAIWSADPNKFFEMPAVYFASFLRNHGMLNIKDRPQWRVIKGGSREYVRKLITPIRDRVLLSSPVEKVTRGSNFVEVTSRGRTRVYDQVIIAAHSDQALRMLGDAGTAERDILGAIPYQRNDTVLHTDERIMPKKRLAWAAWNYHLTPEKTDSARLTYNMNILQTLPAKEQFCVTLNRGEVIDNSRVRRRFEYHHPVYTFDGVEAQKRWEEINGRRRTWFCGAYWGYGFHEDGVKSALRVCEKFGQTL